MIDEYGFKKLLEGKGDIENLKYGLRILTSSGICSGCKAEIKTKPEEDRCKIRQCCYSKGFDLCLKCFEFPCKLLKTNPGVIKFHCIEKEIKEKGIKDWIDKQWKKFYSQLEE